MQGVYVVIFTAAGVWLLIVTVILVISFRSFRKLTKEVDKGNLVKVLEKVLEKQQKSDKELSKLFKEVDAIKEDSQFHVQKVGLIRFNPFKELGGDHSFSLALLNGKNTGFVITGLHTRERTRVYVKDIKKGKSEFDLSTEEKKVLKKTIS